MPTVASAESGEKQLPDTSEQSAEARLSAAVVMVTVAKTRVVASTARSAASVAEATAPSATFVDVRAVAVVVYVKVSFE